MSTINILEELRAVQKLRGDTYSSAEVLGMVGRAADEIAQRHADLRIAGEKFAEACDEIERLRTALKRVLADIADYERVNNLAPNPGRQYCWDSVAHAHAVLNIQECADPSRCRENKRGKTE